MTVMPVNGQVLKWAREIRRIPLEDAARKLKWDADRLRTVEEDKAEVSDSDLEKLAKAYKLPIPTLLMPEPLPEDRYPPRPLADYRLHRDGVSRLGIETLQFVEDGWELLDLFVELGETRNLPHFRMSDDAAAAAERERIRFATTVQEQLGWENDRTAYLAWRSRIEDAGVIVHALNIKEEDIRGFALFHEGATLIGINKNEPKDRAKAYSLWHEYAHLLLRCSGLSDHNRSVPVERWCNQFAANFLLPAEAVREFMREKRLLGGNLGDYHVSRVAAAFKVSNSAVAIRFEELGLAPAGFYERLKAKWQKPLKSGGFDPEGTQVKVQLNRYGARHVNVVLEALKDGRINAVEARYALNVDPRYHREMLVAAEERRRLYGKRQTS